MTILKYFVCVYRTLRGTNRGRVSAANAQCTKASRTLGVGVGGVVCTFLVRSLCWGRAVPEPAECTRGARARVLLSLDCKTRAHRRVPACRCASPPSLPMCVYNPRQLYPPPTCICDRDTVCVEGRLHCYICTWALGM